MPVRLLGGLELIDGSGSELQLPTRKAALVVAALCLKDHRGLKDNRAVTRAALAEQIWPDRSEEQSRSSLRQALTAIRKRLPDMLPGFTLETTRDRLELTGPSDAVDVRHFAELVESEEPSDMAAAADLYRGDLLEGMDLPEPFEEALAPVRSHLRHQALVLVEALSALPDPEEAARHAAEALATRLLTGDPAAEEAHRALIRLRLAEGQTNAARRQLDLCIEAVGRHFGAEPEARTLALLEIPASTAPATAAKATPISGPATPERPATHRRTGPSVVVMPFDYLGPAEDDFFADGVVDEITAALSRVRDFFVIARQTAYTYKDRFVDARQVGRDLGVRYLVEGTVRRGGERFRITVQLVETETGTQLWSDRYEGDRSEQFELQDHIASHVAGALQPGIRASEIEIARQARPEDRQAYDFVMQALPHFWAHRREDNLKAITLFDQALEREPEYGVALAYKAWCHAQQASYLWTRDPLGERALAVENAEKAARFSRDHAGALTAIGAAYTIASTERELAESYIARSLEIDPNNAWGWMRRGWLGIPTDRGEQALRDFEHVRELSPYDPFLFNCFFGMASVHARRGDYETAIRHVEQGLRAGPGVTWAYRMLAGFCAMAGDRERALDAARKVMRHNPDTTIERLRLGVSTGYTMDSPEYFEMLRGLGIPEK